MLNSNPSNASDDRVLRISVHNLARSDQSIFISQLQRLVLSLPVLAADAADTPAADVCVVVVDGAQGFTSLARQAAAIARTGGARHIVLAVHTPAHSAHDNVSFDAVRTDFHEYARRLEYATAIAIPVVDGADASGVAWFAGTSLAAHLDALAADMRAASGTFEEATQLTEQFAAHVACIADEELLPGRDYKLKLTGRELTASVTAIKYRLDVDSLHRLPARTLGRGEIGVCTIATQAPVALASDDDVPGAGRFVISDMHSDSPIAVGTVDFALRRGMNVHWQPLTITKELRASLKQQRPCVVWLTGLSGSGKSTLANLVEGWLALRGCHTYLLDGDNVRHGLNKDLGFTAVDRVENIRRVGEVARLFVDAGVIVLCSFISPFRAEREAVRSLLDTGEFIEIHVTAPLEVCEARDPKGLYAKCRAGQLPNFTGIDSPYEAPENADLVLDTTTAPATELAHRIVSLLQARGIVADDDVRERVGRGP
jgi:bifunctional enzyme CysN/CysC